MVAKMTYSKSERFRLRLLSWRSMKRRRPTRAIVLLVLSVAILRGRS